MLVEQFLARAFLFLCGFFCVVESKISNWFLLCFCVLHAFRFYYAHCGHIWQKGKVNANIIWLSCRPKEKWWHSHPSQCYTGQALSSPLTQHEIQICCGYRTAAYSAGKPTPNPIGHTARQPDSQTARQPDRQSACVTYSQAWLLPCPIVGFAGVSFFIFESSSCTRSMESSRSGSSSDAFLRCLATSQIFSFNTFLR